MYGGVCMGAMWACACWWDLQICLTSPRDTVLMPCLHFMYCKGCVAQHRRSQNLCPVCRTGISGELIVHLQQ